MDNQEQQFLNDLDAKLWKAADKLRSNLDAANYKHVVLGLIFLKYVSDAFEERQLELIELFKNDSDDNIYYLPAEDYASDEEYQAAIADELELLEYYQEQNVFWVPKTARWSILKDKATLPAGTVLWQDDNGQDVKLRSVSWLIDNALDEIEKSNQKLKGILNRISQYQLDNDKLIGLINTFSDTSFSKPVYQGQQLNLHSKDILGHVYEYFLGQFALAEGKQGGQYYTPKSIVTLIVEMLEPYQGRVYDPAMGSGGFFVSSDKFIEQHANEKHYDPQEQKKHISVYGQESNPTTWKLAAMNMAIRGIDFNFGKKNADSFLDDQHPDLRADFVMANPPFNMKEWWHEKLADDVRWKYDTPPQGNANFAWMQHMLHHLNNTGSMALLLANGSMSSNTNNEGTIRKNLIEADLVACMVALPGQLFTNTQIPACIWLLSKAKVRKGEVLFIDARNLGFMKDRVLRDFTAQDIQKIADTYHVWQKTPPPPLPQGEGRGEGESLGKGEIERKKYTKIPEKLLENARQLRKNQTDAEKLLWQLLRNRQIENAKFRRQHPLAPYILDFYCHEHQLVIELDGGQHFTPEGVAKDKQRTAFIEKQGITVMRFDNQQVLTETEAVLEKIYDAIVSLTPTLSLRERELNALDGEASSPLLVGEDLGEGNHSVTYQNIPGFCFSAKLDDIQQHDYVLTPGRYVGAAEQEDDGEPFAEKMQRLTEQLAEQFAESDRLEFEIKENLKGLGYEC